MQHESGSGGGGSGEAPNETTDGYNRISALKSSCSGVRAWRAGGRAREHIHRHEHRCDEATPGLSQAPRTRDGTSRPEGCWERSMLGVSLEESRAKKRILGRLNGVY